MNELPDHTDICPVCGFNRIISENPRECLELGYLLGGRFVIGKALGIGSFSVSYIAWDCVDEIPVTVKEFLPSDLACHHSGSSSLRFFSDDDREAFQSGLSKYRSLTVKLSELSHLECVHNIIAFINENETGYAVMEYLVGQTLKHFLSQYRTLTYADVLDIMCPVIRTVSALHKENIYHLSISPDNIFLCDDGRVTLLNFASARFEMFSDTSRRSIFLHHGFAPIEMYSDSLSADSSSDVYSLCAVIYKMITGAVPPEPFARRDGAEILSPEKLGFTVPEKTQKALMQGLSLYQKDRIRSADELLRILDDSGVSEKKNIFSRLSPKAVIAAVACIAVIITAVIVAVSLSGKDKPSVDTDDPTVSETVDYTDIPSDFTLTDCNVDFDSISLLETADKQPVSCDVFVFSKNNLLGLIKTDGTVIKEASYRSVVFDSKKNAVLLDGNSYITLSGSPITVSDNEEADNLPALSDKYLFDAENYTSSRVGTDENYPQFVSEGSFIVSDSTGKFGLITRGNLMVDIVYDEALPLSCGVTAFRQGNDWSYLSIYGHDIFERTFTASDFGGKNPFSFSEGTVPLPDKESGLWGYYDFNGDILIESQFLSALPFVNGRSFVKTTDGWQIISLAEEKEDTVTSLCGNNATFTLNITNGLLEISGSGEIWDFTKTNSPWHPYRNIIRTVRITGQITYIGTYSFYGFTALSSVTLPGSLLSVGSSAFESCRKLRSISLPSSLTLICDEAFKNCTALSSLVCPSSLNYIGISAFRNCTDITKVSLGDNLYTLSEYAFYGCSSVTQLFISSKYIDIGNYAFAKCTSLKEASLPSKASSIGKGAFLDCSSLSTVTVPLGVTEISDEAFKNCSSLTEATFSDGLVTVGNEAFSGCTSLQRATLPQSVRTVGDRAFCDCSSLVSASVPSAVTIGAYAFSGCISVSSFEISETVRNLGAYAFNGWLPRQNIYGKNMLLKLTIAKPFGWDSNWNKNCNANISAR